MLSYSPSHPPPKSRISNKRVAFPLSPNTTTPTSSGATQIPNVANENIKQQLCMFNPEESLALTISNFENLMRDDQLAKLNNLDSKLELLKTMWIKGELPEEVQKHILDISKFLCENNTSKASELELQLIMKYGAISGSWISLVTYLINRR